MGGLLALLLLLVFAVCVLSVLLTGADTYQTLTRRDQDSYDRRTAAQYLATRVRQADRADGIAVADFQGCDALELTETIDGTPYITRVYCYDGYLRELFSAAEAQMTPADGEKVLEAQALTVEWMDGNGGEQLLEMELTNADGTTQRVVLSVHSGKGASS
mgnify:FL=1